jgi:branched-chain amino acid transport system substrate-binding protein
VYAKGKGEMEDQSRIGSIYYNRGVVHGIVTVEAIRKAQEKIGKKPLTGEQVRWGIENLQISEARLKELGAASFMQPIKVTCADHEGGGAVKFQQWDGNQWKVITDWIQPDSELVAEWSRNRRRNTRRKRTSRRAIARKKCDAVTSVSHAAGPTLPTRT